MRYTLKATAIAIAAIAIAVGLWVLISLAVGADYAAGGFYYRTELTANLVLIGSIAPAMAGMVAGLVKIN